MPRLLKRRRGILVKVRSLFMGNKKEKKAYLIEKDLPQEGILKVLSMAKEDRAFGKQGVGTNHKLRLIFCNSLTGFPFFFGRHRAGQQAYRNAQGCQQFRQGVIMLLCQNLRRSHQCCLTAILDS